MQGRNIDLDKAESNGAQLGDVLPGRSTGASHKAAVIEQQKALAVSFAVLESPRLLTKSFRVGDQGAIEKTGSGAFAHGTATRVDITGSDAGDVLRQFGRRVVALTRHQAITTVAPPAGKTQWAIVKTADLDEHPGAIARSREHFRAAHGAGLLAIDFDTRTYPPELRAKIAEVGDLTAVLFAVFPGFQGAASLRRNSTSSGVACPATKDQTTESGQHRYFVVADGIDAADFAQRLHDRFVLNGFGFGVVRKTGYVDICSPIDRNASAPERIVYEADAELGEGLVHLPRSREPIVAGGGLLDTRALPSLTDVEGDRLAAISRDIRHALRHEAAAQEAIWIEERVRERVVKGESEDAARRSLTRAVRHQELAGAIEVELDDGTAVTVAEILANPAGFHGKTCADPLEPEYGGGRNLAIIYTNGHSRPIIHSQAHGGIRYALWPDLLDFFDIVTSDPANDRDQSSLFNDQPQHRRKLALQPLSDVLSQGLDAGAEPLVEGLLDQGSLSVLYGDSNVGKTFVAMGLAFSVACNSAWAGQKTAGLPVVYVAAEGGRGASRRLRALVDESGATGAPFYLYPSSVDLLRADAELEPLIEAVKDIPGVGLVVIDTLSRALAGGDENSPVDMGKLVRNVDRLRRETGVHALIVHHSGKNQAKGARGHSSLRAATDTEIEVSEGRVSVTKQRDMEGGFQRSFRLKTSVLGLDNRGKVVTSCTVIFGAPAVVAGGEASRAESEVLAALGRLHAAAPNSRGFSIGAIQDSGELTRECSSETVRSHLRRLATKRLVERLGHGSWRLFKGPDDTSTTKIECTGTASMHGEIYAPDNSSGKTSVTPDIVDIMQ